MNDNCGYKLPCGLCIATNKQCPKVKHINDNVIRDPNPYEEVTIVNVTHTNPEDSYNE